MKEIVVECKPFKQSHVCRMDAFLEDAQAKVLSPKRYIAWLQKKVDNTRGGFFRKQYLEKMVRILDKMGKRDEEADETDYWLNLFRDNGYLDETQFASLSNDLTRILKLLTSIVKTMRQKVGKG